MSALTALQGGWLAIAADAVLKTTALLVLIALIARLLRNASASLRHFVWSLGVIGLLVLPLLSRATPMHVVVMRTPPAVTPAAPRTPVVTHVRAPAAQSGSVPAVSTPFVSETTAFAATVGTSPEHIASDLQPATTQSIWPGLLIGAWLLGALILLSRLGIGLAIVQRIIRRSAPLEDPDSLALARDAAQRLGVTRFVALQLSDDVEMPFAHGVIEPTVILPASFTDWTTDRREAVLTHELAHISRGDLSMNLLSQGARALYWFNPLVWVASHRLRVEGERACDDAVLRAGSRASDYADHLLSIVSTVAAPVPEAALAMARQSDFEGRLLAILEPGVSRERLTRVRAAALAAGFLIVLTPLAAMTAAPAQVADETSLLAQQPTASAPASATGTKTSTQATGSVSARSSSAATASTSAQSAPAPDGAVSALIETLADANASVRVAAAKSLAQLGDPRAIAALSRALREDTDPRVREAAAEALGDIEDVRAVPALIAALGTEKVSSVREKIVGALGNLKDPSAAAGIAAAAKDQSVAVRREVAQALGNLEDRAAAGTLIEMTRDDDAEVRHNAAEALGNIKAEGALDALSALTRDSNSDVREQAISALADLEDIRAEPAIVAALKDPVVDVRREAADALDNLEGIHTAPQALIDLLRDPSRSVRKEAASTLGSIKDPAAVPALKAATADDDAEVRRNAAEALSDIGGPEAIQVLLGLLKDPDPEVRKIAAEALGSRH
jgi:HEAT repeat protein/beta-lactamase regulating signal transducer with metallopeptidase domain